MMSHLKKVVVAILTLEARVVLWRFKPRIIAVVGSVGKTSTKDAIHTALKETVHVRKNQKSLNSELGVPLTILGLTNAWNNPYKWALQMLRGALSVFARTYPAWLVLEVGADRPGDVQSIARWLRPHIVVVTSLPDVPVHVEFFDSPEALIAEDLSILAYMQPGGTLVINGDEERALSVIADAKLKTIMYGSKPHAAVHFEHVHVVYDEHEGVSRPVGISCKVSYKGNSVPLSMHGVLGVTHLYPMVAALATGIAQDIPFLPMVTALTSHEPPRGRMCIIEGRNGSTIIDDTYNASPVAVERALETLASLTVAGNKIAVLGDMLEIGSYTASMHKQVGVRIAECGITYFVGIGVRMQYAVEAAIAAGMSPDHVVHVRTSDEAATIVERIVKPADVVLVKGSQGIRAERVVKRVMAHPEDAPQLLVRQDDAWNQR